MTRKPKISDKPDTQGAKDSLEGTPPEEAKAPITADPQQAAAPAEADATIPSATHPDAAGDEAAPAAPDTASTDAPVTSGPAAAAEAALTRPPADTATRDGGPAEADIRVVCHATDGRRRLGRRWPHGETVVPAGLLDADALRRLRDDPLFTVLSGA
ncbi:hypothetical protein GCM10007291_22170 [Gemmobacter nanjingensis]|uniref:Mu-like prophage FluMu N-terminal domain-containing protein n=1 Tax=Gemmobacter nanjingensis TaxID=488454 RepID=A0ABQ3FFR4_9RHOB|nr:hypothetical protein [Gemmobacter nanjingensis]GHC22322.1 hypothetical protein GCM10007291_22170 [Gemmobacter nanjingensis]